MRQIFDEKHKRLIEKHDKLWVGETRLNKIQGKESCKKKKKIITQTFVIMAAIKNSM